MEQKTEMSLWISAHLVPFAWVSLPTTFLCVCDINSENLSDPIFLLKQRQLIIISSPFALLMYSFSIFLCTFYFVSYCFLSVYFLSPER